MGNGALEISRRVMRDGTSDYRIGGRRARPQRCRRPPHGTPARHPLVRDHEQGRIGQVLLGARDRAPYAVREAAGISKFRVRRPTRPSSSLPRPRQPAVASPTSPPRSSVRSSAAAGGAFRPSGTRAARPAWRCLPLSCSAHPADARSASAGRRAARAAHARVDRRGGGRPRCRATPTPTSSNCARSSRRVQQRLAETPRRRRGGPTPSPASRGRGKCRPREHDDALTRVQQAGGQAQRLASAAFD